MSQDSGRNDGTCNLCYRICIINYGKSYIAKGTSDLLPKIATWTRNGLPGHVRCSGQHQNPHFFRFMANHTCNIRPAISYMHPLKRQDGHSKSKIRYHTSCFRHASCHISYHLWQMHHAASVILDATSSLAYTVSKIIKKTLEDAGSCPTSS